MTVIMYDFFSMASVVYLRPAPHSGTRGHPFRVGHARVQTDVRRRAFTVRSVKQWIVCQVL